MATEEPRCYTTAADTRAGFWWWTAPPPARRPSPTGEPDVRS